MYFDEWAKKYKGKKIDFDGVFGVQCVDLIKHYIKNVLDIEPQSIGNAIDYYNKRSKLNYLICNFKWEDYKKDFKFKKGDIVVFKSQSKYGHIAVCNGSFDKDGFYIYDQNYKGTGAGMTERYLLYNNSVGYKILGVLRPLNQNKISKPVYQIKATHKATATISVFCNSQLTDKIGTIYKNDKIQILGVDEINKTAFLVYPTSNNQYKVGIIKLNINYTKI